jgi:membrane protein DedA with SNARE-associated domain/rhodanese-related sulfurtransferase
MEVLNIVMQHGYLLVALAMFAYCMAIPLPASLMLVAAGTLAAEHFLNPWLVLAAAIGGSLAGDLLMFFGGRTTGWWLMSVLCRLSFYPDKCIFRSANFFYKRGARTLLFAKFVPGVAMMAAPVAGSLNMRPRRFVFFDVAGLAIYCGAYITVGLVFHSLFAKIAEALHTFGQVVLAVVVVAVLTYAVTFLVMTLRDQRYLRMERIQPAELAGMLETPDPERVVIIADVRSHGYYEPKMERIQNSIRIEPNRLAEEMAVMQELLEPECEVFVYCTCAREATSARVAHMLRQRGYTARVIEGGLRAWKKGGYPVEPVPLVDIEHLPEFN